METTLGTALLPVLHLREYRNPPTCVISSESVIIWIDLEATDDPPHGNQQGRFFHGYYRHYCYLPLYLFCGEHLLCARLREANRDASAGGVEELERIGPSPGSSSAPTAVSAVTPS